MNKITLPLSARNEIIMGDESPRNKVKFLCSYGGKVLPRPSDGLLRYVGGETRVVSVPREITFAELMKKVSSMVEGVGEMVLKYQLIPEDLDALVSVRTQEDVKHMIEEHDRHHTGGLLRAFLFPPSKQTGLVACEPYLLEQRYIDAINGIIRASPRKGSACSSPKSNSPDASPRFSISNSLQRVQSSPTLTNLGVLLDHQHQGHHPNFHLSRPPQDPQRLGGGRTPAFNYHYSNITRQPPHRGDRGGGYTYYDDSPPAYALDRIHSVSRSPRRKSIWE